MKITEVAQIITMRDIEKWLDNQADDEVFTAEEIAVALETSVEKIIKRISNIPPKYRYMVRRGESYYGNPTAISTLKDLKRVRIYHED